MSDEQVHGRWDKDQQRYEDGEKSHPCVHAPDGPDWAGTREPSSWKERALAAEAQLDSMTVETRTDWKFIPMTARGDEGRSEKVREQRLVSPWTVVPNAIPLEVATNNASETGSDLNSEGDDQ